MTTTTIAAGQRSGVHTIAPGVVVTATPAAGASAIVEYTTSAASDITNNVATWKTWPNGTVTSLSAALCNKRGFVRATAIGGAVVLDTNFGPTNEQLAPYETDWGGLLGVSGGGVGLKSAGVLAQSAVPASVTGTVAETTLATIVVPANAMGLNGSLRISLFASNTNNANNKTLNVRFGGVQLASAIRTTTLNQGQYFIILNRGAANSQIWYQLAQGAGLSEAVVSVDTTQTQNLTITGTLANAADTFTVETYTVEILSP